ncbi:aminoglycoside phosphotransferase family protein [Arthrobacter sp. ISL-95]|uniref:aminoglycoside phosphotransferase family protein n=1 Tax=Arthrobacter sp. ISL-95 TaxID=2819116 RepID=UPI001BEC06BD|nr:aminoglycoside phosphotransferase family protein [Arthrobacter sp. ISL-95]MBT2584971.1 hypothetical protein [Arthrobacter sp. ISL-95]
MNAAMDSRQKSFIRSTRTDLLSTGVYEVGRSYEWVHSLGIGAPIPFSSLPVSIDSVPDDDLLVVGVGGDRHRSYSTPAGSTVLDLITAGEPANLRAAGRLWGTALNCLHDSASIVGDFPESTPRTVQRSEAWLEGTWEPAREVLGELGLLEIRRWINSILSSPDRVVVHGYPGMAHWVVTPNGAAGSLLTGEDVGLAHPAYDIAWVLGEMAELHAFHPALRPALDEMRNGFLETCGAVPGPTQIGPALAFRIAQHAYDWHHYAGAGEAQAKSLLRLAGSHMDTTRESR